MSASETMMSACVIGHICLCLRHNIPMQICLLLKVDWSSLQCEVIFDVIVTISLSFGIVTAVTGKPATVLGSVIAARLLFFDYQ